MRPVLPDPAHTHTHTPPRSWAAAQGRVEWQEGQEPWTQVDSVFPKLLIYVLYRKGRETHRAFLFALSLFICT